VSDDPYDLDRFAEAQDPVYAEVCDELRDGRKRTHWMWFVFPILTGLANSPNAKLYAISSLAEARAYNAHDVLGPRLRECVELAIDVDSKTAREIFGETDAWKLHQCLTLFATATDDPVFSKGLDRFYDGRAARHTTERLKELESGR
jgi:uncharacterized protein (DUF1810 family)